MAGISRMLKSDFSDCFSSFPCVCILLICFLGIPAQASSFTVPEVLKFDLFWAGLKAGETSLEVRNVHDGITISSATQSASWVSVFYTVRDRVESRLIRDFSARTVGSPVHYRIQLREGRNRKDKEVIFDRTAMKARYVDHLGAERRDFDLPQAALDPLSGLYQLRTLRLDTGKPVFIKIFDSQRVWDVEIQVLGRQTVEVPAGTFKTILVKPLLKSEGIFSRRGEILIWMTDDEKRIPVQMKTKIKLGSVAARLAGGTY